MHLPHGLTAACATLLALPLAAQAHGDQANNAPIAIHGPSQAVVTDAKLTPAQRAPDTKAFLVPIHTHPADPVGGEYGWWAGAYTYKVSFHDGYAFYPYLGAAYPKNLPLRWSTRAVTVGGESLWAEGTAPVHHRAQWRYEYRYPNVTEAYDVLDQGVEQTFTIWARPTAAGDLVVRGEFDTELNAERVESEHAAITFRDAEGKPILEYGKATVIDAAGRRLPIATTFDGKSVRLTVPGTWLANATYPVVVDPLTSRATIATWGLSTFGLSSYPEVGRDDEAVTDNVMTFYARQVSASDFDGYARLTDDDFSGTGLVFTDLNTGWSTGRAGVAFVGGANRWVLALERDFPASNTIRSRVYVHDSGNTTLNSGTTMFHDPSSSEANRLPAIGGTAGFSSGNNALLVYQADVTSTRANTSSSRVYGVLINAATPSIGSRFLLWNPGSSNWDQEYPDVNQVSDGGSASWIAAFQQLDNNISGDDWDVETVRVTSTGTVAGMVFQGPSGGTPLHKRNPQVSGRGGRYMVSFLRDNGSAGTGSEIMVARFDWSETAATPVKKQIRTVISDTVTQDFSNGGLSYDSNSDSHWAMVYQRGGFTTGNTFVRRLGFSGGTTEAATLYSSPNGSWSPNVTFNDDASEFLIVYGSNDNPPTGLPVYGQRLQYDSNATNVLYGTGCGPGNISADRPLAGLEGFTVFLSAATASRPATLLCSSSASSINLSFIGMTGCFTLTAPGAPFLFSIGTGTNASGSASISFNLPDAPVLIGNLYFQWAYIAPGLNPLGVGATRGLRSQVR